MDAQDPAGRASWLPCAGVPFTPICAIIFCLILIFGLNWETWVRFAVWFALGLVVYFTYSRKHSQLNEPGLF